jgi:segregation and condensation protein B
VSEHDQERPPEELLRDAVEAVVFASPEPVHPAEIAEAFGDVPEERVQDILDSLVERYAGLGGGLFVERVAGGYRFATRPEVGAWVRQFFRQRNRTRLTPATLEVLAIVAYRQPVTAPEVQAVRGKDPTYGLKVLLEKKLIRILGRKKVVGNPLLYGTTKRFLEHFGLNNLGDLPSIEEFDAFLGSLDGAQGRLFVPADGEPADGDPPRVDELEAADAADEASAHDGAATEPTATAREEDATFDDAAEDRAAEVTDDGDGANAGEVEDDPERTEG